MPYDEDGIYYDDDRGHSGYQPPAPAVKGEADILREIEQNKKKALGNLELKTDEDGNSTLFGLKVDKAMLPTVQMALTTITAGILDQGKNIYKGALSLAYKIGLRGENQKVAAQAADMTIRWGSIAAKQISDTVTASGEWAKKRKDLYAFFHPIMEATNINGNNNEVIGLAFARASNDYRDSLKSMITDIPTVLPMAMLGMQEQKLANGRYTTEAAELANKSQDPLDAVKKQMDEAIARHEKQAELLSKSDELIEKARKDFIEKGLQKVKKSDQTSGWKERETSSLSSEFRRNWERPLRDQFKLLDPEKQGNAVSKEEKEKSDKTLVFATLAGGLVSQVLKSNWAKNQDKKDQTIHVPEMIDELRKQIASQCDGPSKDEYGSCEIKSADNIQISDKRGGNSLPLKAYLLQMFQQHERDREPTVNWVKRDKHGYVVEIVDPLGPALVAKLEPSIDIIADAIANGLDPAAMVNLIGGNKIIAHGKNGAKKFANEDTVRDEIDKLMPLMSSHEVINLEEYLAKFEKPDEIKNTIKNNLTKMKGEEQILFASLFPDDVLKQLGMKRNEITDIRKEAHAGIYDFVAANVVYLAKKDEEGLKTLGLAEGEIKVLHDLAEKIEAGDEKAVKTAVDGHDKSVIDAVRTAGLLEQHHGEDGKQYWSGRISEMAGIHEKFSEAAKSADSGEDKHGDDREDKKDRSDTHHGYEDDDREKSSYADRVSKKGSSRYGGDPLKKMGYEHSEESDPDDRLSMSNASSYEGSRGRFKPYASERSGGYTEHARRGRDSSVDDGMAI